MPTTSNFGWTTPADTDLVKDGALAIRTLGNGIDTSMAQLKGGTTGQVLSKTSNTDMAFTWINNDQGDITEVQAGTGISVVSGTGPIPVVTNTVATAFDAKGDLIGGTGADTFARLAVGTNGQVLTADSTTATGLKWASAAIAFKGVLCTKSASQSISNATWTAITYDTEVYDTDNFHSTSSNTSRLTVPTGLGGYYLITWGMFASNGDAANNCKLYVNTTDWGSFYFAKNGSNGGGVSTGSVIINLSAGDYIEQQVYSGAMSIDSNAQNSRPTRFGMQYLGA